MWRTTMMILKPRALSLWTLVYSTHLGGTDALSLGEAGQALQTGAGQVEMRLQSLALAASALPMAVNGINVVVSNDDGWVSR